MTTCLVSNCERPAKTRGMCGMHTERVRNGQPLDTPPVERRLFEDLFTKGEGCWMWQGYIDTPTGYGKLGRAWAHRVSHQRLVGPIPEGYQIDHLCRVRACVNPDHLEAVTQAENIRRGDSPSAIAVRTNRCRHGHELTPENTYVRLDGLGRQCKTCNRRRNAAAREAKAA